MLAEAAEQARIVLKHLQPTLNQQAYSLRIDGDVGNVIQGQSPSVTIVHRSPPTRRPRRK